MITAIIDSQTLWCAICKNNNITGQLTENRAFFGNNKNNNNQFGDGMTVRIGHNNNALIRLQIVENNDNKRDSDVTPSNS